MHPEDAATLGVEGWIRRWGDFGASLHRPPCLPTNVPARHLFALRVTGLGALEVPIEAAQPLLESSARLVETDAMASLSIHLNISLVHLPAGGPPELCGVGPLGPRLPLRHAELRLHSGEAVGGKAPGGKGAGGKASGRKPAAKGAPALFVSCQADPPQLFFFHSSAAPSHELQILAEVWITLSPALPAQQQQPPLQPQPQHQDRTASSTTKAPAAPQAPAAAASASATAPRRGWGLAKASYGVARQAAAERPLGASVDAVTEGIKASPHGWQLVPLEFATEGGQAALQVPLFRGSLYEELVKAPEAGAPKGTSALLKPEQRGLAALAQVEKFLKPAEGHQVGTLDFELELVPLPDVVSTLLPPNFPAVAGMRRLGGLRCPPGRLAPSGDVAFDLALRGLGVLLPRNWREAFLRSLKAPAAAAAAPAAAAQGRGQQRPSGKGGAPPTPQSRAGKWELLGMHAMVGTHNALHWLDKPLRELRDRGAAPFPLDDAGHAWKLELSQGEGADRWAFAGEAPLSFVCDEDCALVLELVASVQWEDAAGVSADLFADEQKKKLVQRQTVGWALLLPRLHATREALLRQRAAAGAEALGFELPLRHLPAVSPLGQQVWKRQAVLGEPAAPDVGPEAVSLALAGERFIRWLCRSKEVKKLLAVQPVTLPSAPVPQAVVTQPDQRTAELLHRPPTELEVSLAKHSEAQPPPPPQAGSEVPPPVLSVPVPAAPLSTAVPQPAAPPEVQTVPQTVVERVYLRDQGTQSDPPPLPDAEDHIIGGGRPLGTTPPVAKAERPYTGETVRPLDEGVRAQMAGDSAVGRLLRGRMPGGQRAEASMPARSLRWRLEEEDPLQADEITMEFITHRSLLGALGERIYLQVRFFVFPICKTAMATLAGGPGEACMLRNAVTNERLALVYHVDGAAAAAAADEQPAPPPAAGLEGSQQQGWGPAEAHRRLVQHLAARCAEVEVWDADAAMQLGLVPVPLEPLVRQGRPVARAEGEHPILDPMTGEARGFLKVLLTCRGQEPCRAAPMAPVGTAAAAPGRQVQLPGVPLQQLAAVPQPRHHAGEGRGGGPVRHKARALLELGGGLDEAKGALAARIAEDPEEAGKKQQRLRQLRALRRADAPDRFSSHAALLSAAQDVRQDRKRAEVARRMDQFNTSKVQVVASFATPTFFHLDFVNPYAQQATFQVAVYERRARTGALEALPPQLPPPAPLHGVLTAAPEAALSLVQDPGEWQRLVRARKVPPPPGGDYTLLKAGTPGVGAVLTLGGYGEVGLPFRYLAFDLAAAPAAERERPQQQGESLAHVAQLAGSQQRTFLVEISLHRGAPLRRVEASVQLQPCAVDRTIRYFEAEGTPLEKSLALPALPPPSLLVAPGGRQQPPGAAAVHRDPDGGGGRFVFCTDRDVHVRRREDDEVSIRLLVPQAPQTRSFFLLFYGSPDFSDLLAVQLVEVQGLRSEHLRVVVGQSVDQTLCLPPMEVQDAGAVRIHSSLPEVVSIKQSVEVDPRFGARFVTTVSPMQVGTSLCRLHAVDPATRRLLAALLLVVVADPPELVHEPHEITLPVLTAARKWLPYKNDTARPLRYTVKSSDPAVVTVQTPELVLPALDTRHIELLFHACPATLSYNAQVFIFIASEDRAIQETRLLQLTYT